jgi:hypothetical protein
MPCGRKKFSGAEELWVESGNGKHQIWVKWPRDLAEEAKLAAVLEEERAWRVNRQQKSNKQIFWQMALIATNQWPVSTVQNFPTTTTEIEASADIQALTPSTSSTPVTPASITNSESQTMTQSEVITQDVQPTVSNTTPGAQNAFSSEPSQKSQTHSLPPSSSPPRKRARVESISGLRGDHATGQARDDEVIMSEGAGGQEEGENEVLWKLVDVLMEQKELMQGKVKSLEWKVSRTSGLQQGEGIDGHIASLADSERELVQRLHGNQGARS